MNDVPVMIAVELNLFPFRTEKLKPLAPKILEEISGKIGRRRDIVHNIIFYKSLVLILSFIYNPFVLKRAERGFHSFKK